MEGSIPSAPMEKDNLRTRSENCVLAAKTGFKVLLAASPALTRVVRVQLPLIPLVLQVDCTGRLAAKILPS